MNAPDSEMMAAPEALARFLETGDLALLDGVFSDGDVRILENFPPHIFDGQSGLTEWKALMARHIGAIEQLRHTFEPPQDFSVIGDTVHFTLPTRWRGVRDSKAFSELGGWTFVQVREADCWRIRSYGWAVVEFAWES